MTKAQRPLAEQRAARLRRIMARHRLTTRDVATRTFKSPEAVRCWLRGARNMPEGSLRLLQTSLGD